MTTEKAAELIGAVLPHYGGVIGYMVLTDSKDHLVRADWDGNLYPHFEDAQAAWSEAMQRLGGDGVYLAELLHIEPSPLGRGVDPGSGG